MNWLYANINHLTFPLGMLLALFTVVVGLDRRRRDKSGLPLRSFQGPVKAITYAVLGLCCVLLGIALVRNFVG
jgi:hypothetical protein